MCELLNVRIHVSSMTTPLILEEVLELTCFFYRSSFRRDVWKSLCNFQITTRETFRLGKKKKKKNQAVHHTAVSAVLSKLLQALAYSVK